MKISRQAARDLIDLLTGAEEVPKSLQGGVLESIILELDNAQGAELEKDCIVTLEIQPGAL